MVVAVKDLPEFKPCSDLNMQMLNNLRIRSYCQENNLITRIPVISVSGHVDSGKSTTLALVLAEHDIIEKSVIQSLQEEAHAKAQAENIKFDDQMVNVAKIVEKGQEAKNRGITIETNIHRVNIKNKLTVAKDSAEHKEAIELFGKLKMEYEEKADGDKVALHYKTTADIIDCPGHKDYIHNTCGAIGETDIQIVLFPAGGGDDEETFAKMVGPESLSMAHARLGNSCGNQMVFCLSKSELAPERIKERIAFVKISLKKKIGITEKKVDLFPISNTKMVAHNVVYHSDLPQLKEFKEAKFNLMIPDYRNANVKTEVPATMTSVFDVVRYFPPVISHEGTYDNKGAMLQVRQIAKTGHGSVLVCVVINGAIRNGKTLTSTKHGQKLTITSMEQFKKPVEVSATGAHIGIKVKAEDRKFDIKNISQGDLLYCDYPENNIPISTPYARVKILYPKSSVLNKTKSTTRKIGNSALLILGSRHTISIVHIFSNKVNKDTTLDSKDAPIKTWEPGNTIDCLVHFPRPVTLPTVDQAQLLTAGAVLEHHIPVGTLKIIKHIPESEGQALDEVYQEQQSKKNAKNSNQGKKKK